MLVEREEPLEQLLTLAGRANAGQGAIALVSGEAGIGKTSLLAEFRSRTCVRFPTAWGGCEALFTARPLGPLRDMAASFGGKVRALIDDGAYPALLFDAIWRELAERPEGGVLIFEDVHWADHATLDFLRFLGRRIFTMNVLIVMSFREDEIDAEHPLTQVCADFPPSHTFRLRICPLTIEGVSRLDASRLIDPAMLLEITGGNPFFVTELLAARQGSGEEDVPASVRDLVNARLGRLGERECAFLETVSVTPASVDAALVSALFGSEGEMLAMACIGRKLLVDDGDGKLRFRHELARLATMRRIPAIRLQATHARVLAALENSGHDRPLDLLVQHAAGALDGKRVLELAPRAARVAASAGAHREAAAHLGTALRFVDEAELEQAAELYENWAYEASLALGIDDEVLEARRHAITLWRALGRTEKVGDNLRSLAYLHWYRGEAAEADRLANEAVRALDRTGPSPERAMAYSFLSQLHMLNERQKEAIEWGRRALALAEEIGHAEVKIHALNNIGTAAAYDGDEGGVDSLRESLTLALEHGFHEHAARAYTNLSCYAVDFREFELADRFIGEAIAFDTQHDLDSWTHHLAGVFAQLRLEQGRLRDAEAIARGVVELRHPTLMMRLPAASVLARVRMRRGEQKAYEEIADVLTQAIATGEFQHIVPARFALIEYFWLRDAPDSARREVDVLASMDPSGFSPWTEGELRIWAKRTGQHLARKQRSLPEPFRAELSDDELQAAALWMERQSPYAAALAYIAAADQNPAAYLSSALQLLDPMEADLAADKARRLAAAFGVEQAMPKKRRGPYRAARTHPLGLTKREQQVLELMVLGVSNAEISERLRRSRRTIEHHVSSVLGKLNAKSRLEVMLRVQNEPWLTQ